MKTLTRPQSSPKFKVITHSVTTSLCLYKHAPKTGMPAVFGACFNFLTEYQWIPRVTFILTRQQNHKPYCTSASVHQQQLFLWDLVLTLGLNMSLQSWLLHSSKLIKPHHQHLLFIFWRPFPICIFVVSACDRFIHLQYKYMVLHWSLSQQKDSKHLL